MPRPVKCRTVCCLPGTREFIPADCKKEKETVVMTLDEFETIRLIDKEGLSQEQCSKSMQVARTTAQKIYENARKKLAEAITEGLPLKIEGGEYRLCSGKNSFCHMKNCPKQKIRVTVLIENTSENKLACEHGLSLLIEYENKRILLDTGSSEAFGENAEKLGISPADLDALVLSHGHYDHSGGFDLIFRSCPSARVYARKEALDIYLSAGGGLHEISVPKNIALQRERFILTEGIKEILPKIYLVPHNTRGLELTGEKSGLYKKQGENILPDDFAHEQSLVIDSEKGLVIFNSCSHAGAVNIIKEAQAALGKSRVYAYIGGLHMKGKKSGKEICAFSEAEILELSNAFINNGIEKIYTGHCTGQEGFEKLKSLLGSRIYRLTTGLIFNL